MRSQSSGETVAQCSDTLNVTGPQSMHRSRLIDHRLRRNVAGKAIGRVTIEIITVREEFQRALSVLVEEGFVDSPLVNGREILVHIERPETFKGEEHEKQKKHSRRSAHGHLGNVRQRVKRRLRGEQHLIDIPMDFDLRVNPVMRANLFRDKY